MSRPQQVVKEAIFYGQFYVFAFALPSSWYCLDLAPTLPTFYWFFSWNSRFNTRKCPVRNKRSASQWTCLVGEVKFLIGYQVSWFLLFIGFVQITGHFVWFMNLANPCQSFVSSPQRTVFSSYFCKDLISCNLSSWIGESCRLASGKSKTDCMCRELLN